MAEELKQRRAVRGVHRAYMTGITARANELIDNYSPDSESKLNNLKLTLANRLKIIEDLDASIFISLTKAEEINAEITEAGNYSESINEVLLKIDVIQKNKPQPQISDVNVSAVEGTGVLPGPSITVGSNSKLPKLVLKSYSGNPAEFMPFWDSFSAAIDKNSSLTDIEKMTHLKTL